jgi:hypothetical protein
LERLLRYLDEFDDLLSTSGLLAERIRNTVLTIMFLGFSVLVQLGGILLALRHPPLALAAALLMFVTLLYRSVTGPFSTPSEHF